MKQRAGAHRYPVTKQKAAMNMQQDSTDLFTCSIITACALTAAMAKTPLAGTNTLCSSSTDWRNGLSRP